MAAARTKRPRRLQCQWCLEVIDASNPDTRSHWLYQHPSSCAYRGDRVPSLNGVYVGQRWENVHTGGVETVSEIRLGGSGTYTDREPTVLLVEEAERVYLNPHPLWSLCEHWRPLDGADAMPFEGLPMPTEPDRRYPGSLSTLDPWRCPAHPEPGRPYTGDAAYVNTRWRHSGPHTSAHATDWARDPDAVPTLLDPLDVPATYRPPGTPDRQPIRQEAEQLALSF